MAQDKPTKNFRRTGTQEDGPARDDTPTAPSHYEDEDLGATQFIEDITHKINLEPGGSCPFGKYTLLEKIGEGGVGIVYKARANENDAMLGELAIKLMRPEVLSSRMGVQRFRKESRIQAEISNLYVTRHYEFGEHDGSFYIVSEFVDGVNVSHFCRPESRASVRLALLIARDLLRGLDALHEAGIVHRDVKPGNIIASFHPAASRDESSYRQSKLTDFGLARHIEQSESLEMTRQQTVLGTPLYMAPEQYLESRSVDARADIYSVGATLFHLIAGRPPLDGDSVTTLAEMHRVERPIELRKLDPDVGEAVSNVVAKSLEKIPELRYQDAGEMLNDIERILADKPISLRAYPAIPDADHRSVKRYEFEWELDAAVSDLWPLVSDTDRFNQALGLPAPQFTYDHSAGVRKITAEAKFNGMRVRWREHPFQWIRERQMSVLREFESGPFQWMTSTVELAPLAGKRTRVTHRMQVRPRGLLGRVIVPIQFGIVTKRAMNRVYRRLEQLANDANPLACDLPFGKPIRLTADQDRELEEISRQLKKLPATQMLAESLEKFARTAADPMVARICPIPLARRLECEVPVALDACLGAVEVGLFDLSWDVICPVCRVASQRKNSLTSIEAHAFCEVCNLDFDVDLAKSVELIFVVNPAIRTIESATYCIGGPYHAPHIIAQNHLRPAEQVDVGATLSPGQYGLRSRQLNAGLILSVNESAALNRIDVVLGRDFPPNTPQLAAGNVCVAIKNVADVEMEVRLERDQSRRDSISAAEVSHHPKFKQMFPDQSIKVADLVEVSHVFLLMIQLVDPDRHIGVIGDLKNREHWKSIQRILTANPEYPVNTVSSNEENLIVAMETAPAVIDALTKLIAGEVEQPEDLFDLHNYSIVVCRGQVMTGMDPSQPGVFGKAVRDVKTMIRNLPAGFLRLAREVLEAEGADALVDLIQEDESGATSHDDTTRQFCLK